MSESIAIPKTKTLEELSALVGRHEANVGTLKAIRRNGDYTEADYEEGYTPDNSVELIKVGDEMPDGYGEVLRGNCWDSEKPIDCIAIRKQA